MSAPMADQDEEWIAEMVGKVSRVWLPDEPSKSSMRADFKSDVADLLHEALARGERREREACAEVADSWAEMDGNPHAESSVVGRGIADAIRARGKP